MIIDIVSDVVCPWCYVGKRRLEQALIKAPQPDLEISWRPYRLNPDMPDEGMDRKAYMRAKFGDDKGSGAHERLIEIGREVGIPFAFDRIKRAPNTLRAHRLMRHAERAGRQNDLAEALFRAYFIDGQDIGEIDALAAVAAGVGLDQAEARAYLASDADSEAIRAEDQYAREIGIQGVPCYIIDRRYALSGAQPPEAFLHVFDIASQPDSKDKAELA